MSRKNKTPDSKRKAESDIYYRRLMTSYQHSKSQDNKKGDLPIFTMGQILEEVQLLANEKIMSDRTRYNKLFWNLIAVSEGVKNFPDHKSGNFSETLTNSEVKRHFKDARNACNAIISKMEASYSNWHTKNKPQTTKKRRMKSFRELISSTHYESQSERFDYSNNQFGSFVQSNYNFKEWCKQNKKDAMFKADKKWLKMIKDGANENVFKQKQLEQHFTNMLSKSDYPVSMYILKLIGNINKNLNDMSKGMWCNIEKLVKDINNLKDLVMNVVLDGYMSRVKNTSKQKFPMKHIRDSLFKKLFSGIRGKLVPLLSKYECNVVEEAMKKCREVVRLDRLNVDPLLKLDKENQPYKKAIDHFSSFVKENDIDQQVVIIEKTPEIIFQCVDDYCKEHEPTKVGKQILDSDFSQIVFYLLLNSSVGKLESQIEVIRLFKSTTIKTPIFDYFYQVMLWCKDFEVKKDEEKSENSEEKKEGNNEEKKEGNSEEKKEEEKSEDFIEKKSVLIKTL